MNEIEDQDRHQYLWMMKTLEAYQEGQIGLGTLIDTLETYENALQKKPDIWKDSFLINWGELEIIYSTRIAESPFRLSEDDHRSIASAIAGLKDMIRSRIDGEHNQEQSQ